MEEKKHFGVYEVIEEIGRGGISIVYKAKHPTLGKMVAIKVLSPYLSNDAAFIERFHNEAQILSSFRHQNIVYVIDFAKEGNQYYLVMDLIDGYTVKQLLQRTGALPSKIACNIMKNVCTALSYTHRKGIVHRDIKSSNIMVDGNGKIMVTDFGLSKELNVDSLQEAPNEIAGTLAYISPEQLDPKFGHPDIRTDIYSLGVVFYEMVTGKLPFDENSAPVNLAYQHLKTTPPPPSKMNKDLLPKIDTMCLKMLEKKQNNRYQSAEDLLKDIEELEGILLYYKAPEEKAEGSYFEVVSDEQEKPSNEIDTLSEKREEVPVPVYQEDDVYIGKVLRHRYRIDRLLLKRILSSLYEGKDIQNNHPVMIQIPNESRPTFRARIEKDILTMKKVDHPGFVKFIEVVEEDGSCYVIREHIDGFTIKQLLKKQKFDIQQAIEIVLQVLESLKYLHDQGIIHRDLNSDVIIVSNQGQVKIISLGFSRVEDASSVSSGEFLGVVQYTAPEQITQSKSDFRSDIYSVGILLFEMLTGTLPFDSPLPVEVMDMHLKKMPRLPEEAQKTIPLNLQRILLKTLAKSPEQRYQTTGEIIEELKS
ncbi:MAG: serine/threonine-protein kinase, partial [Caldisericia bacterium]|nr:serine/threonine-protein kinase [Caldisericia bacterium]